MFNRIAFWSNNIIQEATIGLPSILVLGATGAGKEFFFNNLYNKLNEMYRDTINPHGELPVKKTNIAAYSGELTFSELFGHKKGAFTSAVEDKKGLITMANGGTLFLDEIGELPSALQVKLLNVIQTKELCHAERSRARACERTAESKHLAFRVSAAELKVPRLARQRRARRGSGNRIFRSWTWKATAPAAMTGTAATIRTSGGFTRYRSKELVRQW